MGLRMANDLLERAGYRTLLLGANTPPGEVAQMTQIWKPAVLCLTFTSDINRQVASDTVEFVRQVLPHRRIALGGQGAGTLSRALDCDLAALKRNASAPVADIAGLLSALR